MEKVTINDLSKMLKVSKSTISKALKGYSDVSEKTRKRIVKLAKKLNYTPNSIASSLKTHQTKTLGVIIPTIVHHFFSKVIDGMICEAEKHGFLIILLQSDERFDLEVKQINLLIQKQVDGILISVSNQTSAVVHLQNAIDKGIPVVMFDKVLKNFNCSKIIIDDKLAAFEAVDYLLNKGYKRIAHFGGMLTPQNSIDRLLGYKNALKAHGIEYDQRLVYVNPNNDDFNDGFYNAKKMLEEHRDIDAIFAITDSIAIGALKYFEDKNIKVPEQIAVFGFSNWFMSSVITPSLSTVNQPNFEMGSIAVNVLLDEIHCKEKNEAFAFKKIVLPTSLIIRKST
ncbi:MAG: LacI family transcriptional regulator [Flavobacteriales bacterium CG11_big_fil_rev_8_21_14_0_20_35_7]|nr:MAG: LacI family transcriptional regulator [Flavobacteriales bacterium CG11_big_fil_rev_8_21_14_0_20_35_7]